MAVRLFFILIISQVLQAQHDIPNMLDSLARANSESERARLSLVISSQLAQDDWKRALKYIDLAEESANNTKSDSIIADTHSGIAEIYASKDAFDISLEHFLKAYRYYQGKSHKNRYRLENDLAITYSQTQNPEKALEFFHKLLKYEHTKADPVKLAAVANNIGLVWMERDVDSATFYFNKSLGIIKEIEKPSLKAMLYTNLARTAALKEDVPRAKIFFEFAINESNKSVNKNLAWIYIKFSELYLKNNELDSAIYYSRNAMQMLDTLAPFSLAQLYSTKVLYTAYVDKKDFRKATDYFERYLAISDSLNIEDRRVNSQKIVLEEEYRNRDKIRELEEGKNRSNMYSFIIGLFALLLVLGAILYRYRNKLKRTELENQLVTSRQKELSTNLELKNKELIGKAMIEMHRAEIIEDILNDLKEVKLKATKKETQHAIDYIAKRLTRDTTSNIWDEFELRFKEVHESFYKNLLEAHPDLTSRDKRLCALLKLNLTSKEIAQITGQPAKSVENARTRLRKKLNINNSQTDLSVYLSHFG